MFTPSQYLGRLRNKRQRYLKRTFLVTFSVAIVTLSSVSFTTYAAPFLRTPQVIGSPSHRIIERPAEASIQSQTMIKDFSDDEYYSAEAYDYMGENGCNVLGITIAGDLGTDYGDTTANDIRSILEEFAGDERVEAILIEVDSSGGSPVAGDEIATLLAEQTVPVIAQIREIGASAAYMAILPADYIFAHRFGSVGSIGVIIPLYDYSKSNEQDGIAYTPILTSSGKDMGTADRPLSSEERAILQSEVDFIYQAFLTDVASYRNLTPAQLSAVANGQTFLSHIAKERGLIDAVGGRSEVMKYLQTITNAAPVVCRPDYVM
jgi:protease-4